MTYTVESAIEALQSGEATIEQIAEATGWEIVHDLDYQNCLVPDPNRYYATDGYAECEFVCDTPEEAAQEYVDGGEWGDVTETTWIKVSVYRGGINETGEKVELDRRSHKITLEPKEPECEDGQEHDWQSPLSIVGGIKENPGVYGHGGGVTIDEVCMRCGCGKTIDTWAQDMNDGEQGLESVRYEVGKYREQIEATAQEEE